MTPSLRAGVVRIDTLRSTPMRRAALIVLATASCYGDSPAPVAASNHPPVARDASADAARAPSPWAVGCKAAIDRGRGLLAQVEPLLGRTLVEIEARADHDRITASAYPPIVKVAPLFVHVGDTTDADQPWQTQAMYELGGDHRLARRVSNHIEISIGLDGWDPAVADRIIAVLEGSVAPCFGVAAANGCATLPGGFSFHASVGPHRRDDDLVLVAPYTVRADRRVAGKLTHCEITLSACGADNTVTADDVIARLADPDVTAALATHRTFGDPARGAFVLAHDSDTLVVGAACTAPGCVPPPPGVTAMVEVLNDVYSWRVTPAECPAL